MGVTLEAFAVEHSLRAPAVGYRISAGGRRVFYVPDLVSIRERTRALSGVQAYIGDGASIVRPIVRWRGGTPFGHAPICTQLDWCQAEGVRRAIFSHCGSQIVGGDERRCAARVRALGRERGVEARLAHDGMEVVLR